MTSIKSRCQGVLDLEFKVECGEREEGSSIESSIIAKELMQCLIMSFGEYPNLSGSSCVTLGRPLD